ncbi:MAG: polysulfide reductase NrfD, partial [Alphaproteobacteria bacterium]
LVAAGIGGWWVQLDRGLAVTDLTDQVVWGLYIGNFVYLVGVAAAAVVLVVPAYVFGRGDVRAVVLVGECMAIAAVVMALLFVTADLGQPARIWHALPFLGRLNFPTSIMAWDMVVLTIYLLLNVAAVAYQWACARAGRSVHRGGWFTLMMLAIVAGLAIHTVTAFMLAGVPARPFWHSAVLAPRFIASAFASGSALMILALMAMRRFGGRPAAESVIRLLGLILAFALLIDLFLLGAEVFTQFYRASEHTASARHLMGDGGLAIGFWLSTAAAMMAAVLLVVHRLRENRRWLVLACALVVPAVWFEKGPGLIVPGFVPTPLGEVMGYAPTAIEILVSVGIWAFGLLLFTGLVRLRPQAGGGTAVDSAVEPHPAFSQYRS